MRITHLSLTNFRNYRQLELELPGGPILIHGDNAQGKTNLLEAISYLATTRSPFTRTDRQLINWETERAGDPIIVGRLVAHLDIAQGPQEIELRLIREQQNGTDRFRREALIDRRKVRLLDLLGNLRVVIFLPQDLLTITGAPSLRRRYVDIILCQADRAYCRQLSEYKKVLDQRNALLRHILESGRDLELLPVYNQKLSAAGSQIFYRRSRFFSSLARLAQEIHQRDLTDDSETLALTYLPRLARAPSAAANQDQLEAGKFDFEWLLQQDDPTAIAQRFTESLGEARKSELASGITQVGPHRDDWGLLIDGREVSTFGSRGQQRTALLAIKLAEIAWMESETGDTPLLLLDEVLAELDEQRRAYLLNTVQNAPQALLTATDPGMFSKAFLRAAASMTIRAGQISRDSPSFEAE